MQRINNYVLNDVIEKIVSDRWNSNFVMVLNLWSIAERLVLPETRIDIGIRNTITFFSHRNCRHISYQHTRCNTFSTTAISIVRSNVQHKISRRVLEKLVIFLFTDFIFSVSVCNFYWIILICIWDWLLLVDVKRISSANLLNSITPSGFWRIRCLVREPLSIEKLIRDCSSGNNVQLFFSLNLSIGCCT